MTITEMRKIEPKNGSKTVAFFDVLTTDGISIRSFKLVNFDGQYTVQPPSRQATQKEKDGGFKRDYVSTVRIDSQQAKSDLLNQALDVYNK
jgi:hypothetical protein